MPRLVLALLLSADVVLDVGVNLGLTKAAEDVNVFTGVTVRF